MKNVSEIAARMGYGPMSFWRMFGDCIRDRREHEGRDWLTYDEYRQVFKEAHRAGLLAVYADDKGEPTARFHSPLGMALLRLYRGVKSAAARGLSPEQFHAEFCLQIERDSDGVKKAVEYREDRIREAREKSQQERRGERRRRLDPDEQEISEVRVGYQPERMPV